MHEHKSCQSHTGQEDKGAQPSQPLGAKQAHTGARDGGLIIKLDDDADSQDHNTSHFSSFSFIFSSLPLPGHPEPINDPSAQYDLMRESNFAFPAQNRASVCISSQLYDRRALDTSSPLPLFNSLSHLTYLTSSSPRIREIMTMDGGLERLVRILLDFCMSPPPPENPAMLYGLLPPNHHPPPTAPTLNPKAFDKQAAYRFSLAFQSIVNIGVRGNEAIRARVVQAGTLEVVGCILEAWLAHKGFAVGPSSSATGVPRETREQRAARRQAQAEQRTREQAAELARALERQQLARREVERITHRRSTRAAPSDPEPTEDEDIPLAADTSASRPSRSIANSLSPSPDPPSESASVDTDAETSTDISTNATPAGSNTPTGAVEVPGRDRSGTIIARPIWDPSNGHPPRRAHRVRDRQGTIRPGVASASTSRGPSRPETETEDDGDVDMDRDQTGGITSTSPSPEPMSIPMVRNPQTSPHNRRAVGIVSDAGPATANASLELNSDAHIIINSDQEVGGDGVGVEDGIVALDTNDDFAMGAPPGAPGAIEPTRTVRDAGAMRRARNTTDVTPRAVTIGLPFAADAGMTPRGQDSDDAQEATPVRPNAPIQRNLPLPNVRPGAPAVDANAANAVRAIAPGHGHHHHRDSDTGPYRDEDVLVSLQLLAYLSKYPHVRQAFYKPRASFHPATAVLHSASAQRSSGSTIGPSSTVSAGSSRTLGKEASGTGFFKAFGRGKEKEKERIPPVPPTPTPAAPSPPRQTNVFSLVERFTFRPSSSESDLPNPPPTLPSDIQYWAGVIMRNACRKDDSRGGIRQCANMLCGRWESYPREFAKCRRCRKAKYCGKECQSTAWSEGHRFWCSAREEEDTEGKDAGKDQGKDEAGEGDDGPSGPIGRGGRSRSGWERRERERERIRERVNATAGGGADTAEIARAVATAQRPMEPLNPQVPIGAAGPADGAASRHAGWSRAFYEPSPFANNLDAGPRENYYVPFASPLAPREEQDAQNSPAGRRRAETMPGGMAPVVDSPTRPVPGRSRFFNAALDSRPDLGAIAGPSRGFVQADSSMYSVGEDLSMDID